jgi:hypothetical protein
MTVELEVVVPGGLVRKPWKTASAGTRSSTKPAGRLFPVTVTAMV